MQTPTSPVNLACAQAMKAAISSWRTWISSGRSSPSWSKATVTPLIPSPGYPNTRRTPHSARRRSRRNSPTVRRAMSPSYPGGAIVVGERAPAGAPNRSARSHLEPRLLQVELPLDPPHHLGADLAVVAELDQR